MKLKLFLAAFLVLFVAGIAVLVIHSVPRTITDEDKTYFAKIYEAADLGWREELQTKPQNLEEELAQIDRVQTAVFAASPVYERIPAKQTREPKDLYEAGHGFCFDRARAMQKMLRALGYETRHASVYSTVHTSGSSFKALTSSSYNGHRIESHAWSEVKTSAGWLVIDSVNDWAGVDESGKIYDSLALSEAASNGSIEQITWDENYSPEAPYFLILKPFTYVYGLYSRHGLFYPPFTSIPDVNWSELSTHFTE